LYNEQDSHLSIDSRVEQWHGNDHDKFFIVAEDMIIIRSKPMFWTPFLVNLNYS